MHRQQTFSVLHLSTNCSFPNFLMFHWQILDIFSKMGWTRYYLQTSFQRFWIHLRLRIYCKPIMYLSWLFDPLMYFKILTRFRYLRFSLCLVTLKLRWHSLNLTLKRISWLWLNSKEYQGLKLFYSKRFEKTLRNHNYGLRFWEWNEALLFWTLSTFNWW